jgi:hypothetical protein
LVTGSPYLRLTLEDPGFERALRFLQHLETAGVTAAT